MSGKRHDVLKPDAHALVICGAREAQVMPVFLGAVVVETPSNEVHRMRLLADRGLEDVGQPDMHCVGSFKSQRLRIEAIVSDYVPCGRGNSRRV